MKNISAGGTLGKTLSAADLDPKLPIAVITRAL
jgi:hypothetical protein